MATVEEQVKLEDDLKKLEKRRDNLTVKIRKTRQALDAFIKDNGNLRLREENRIRWQNMQPIFAERRKDPEWQKWREEFMASRHKSTKS